MEISIEELWVIVSGDRLEALTATGAGVGVNNIAIVRFFFEIVFVGVASVITCISDIAGTTSTTSINVLFEVKLVLVLCVVFCDISVDLCPIWVEVVI